jgi:hypothetical protein
MQPYGKFIEVRNSCMCCGTMDMKRSQAKAELRKLIQEEMDDTVEESENLKNFENSNWQKSEYF